MNLRYILSLLRITGLCFLIFNLAYESVAQTPDLLIDTKVSGPVTVCGDAITFTVTVKNQSGAVVQNAKLFPQMPDGMVYVPASAIGMTPVTQTTANTTYVISDFAIDEQKVMSFQGKANCGLISFLQTSGSSNLVNNKTKITYTVNSISKELFELNGSDSYSVLFAQLDIAVPQNEKNMATEFINTVMSRHITIKNTGLGALTSLDFYLKADVELAVDKLELQTSSGNVILSSTSTTNLGRKYTITNFNGDNLFEEGETITLVDYVRATTGKTSIQTVYTTQWGCSSQVCNLNDVQASFTVYVEAVGGKATIVESNYQVLKQTDFCNESPAEIRYSFINKGSGNLPATRDAAFGVTWTFVENIFTRDGTQSFFIQKADGSLFNIDGKNTYTETQYTNGMPFFNKNSTIKFNNVFDVDPDGLGGFEDVDHDGFYDDLPVGNIVTFVVHVKPTFTGDIIAYTNQANSSYSSIIQYTTWSGGIDYGINNYGRVLYNINYLSQSLTGPSDIVTGNTTTLRFNMSLGAGSSVIQFTKSTFEIDIQVPPGVKLTKAMFTNRALAFTQTGTMIKIRDDFYRTPTSIYIDFDFTLDCSLSTGVLNDKVVMDMYNYSDYACPLARFKLAHVEKDLFIHCGGCSTIETTQFTAERKTLGWVLGSNLYYKYGDLFGSSPTIAKVTASTPGIRLDAAYPKDEVGTSIKGKVSSSSSFSNINAEITYTSPIDQEILLFSSATFVINGVEYALPSSFQPSKTISEKVYTYTFNIPLGGTLPSQLLPGTLFELKAKYIVSTLEGVDRGEYPISEFRGVFFSLNNGNRIGCLGFGDDFMIFQPQLGTNFSGTGYLFDKDGKAMLGSYYPRPANGANNYYVVDFPNEFRPLYYLTGNTVTLPKGYIFDTSKPVEFIFTLTNTSFTFSTPKFSDDKRVVTLPFTDNMPVGMYPVVFMAYVKNDCGNPSNLFVPVTTSNDSRIQTGNYSYRTYAYLPSVSNHISSSLIDYSFTLVNYRRPNLKLTANSLQEGFSDVVNWPVQICNPYAGGGYSDSPNTWIAAELKNDDHSTILQGFTDEHGVALKADTTIFYGPKDADHLKGRNMLMKLRKVNISSCIQFGIVAKYKNCHEDFLQGIKVFSSWDYNDFPALSGYEGSIKDRKASCEGNLLRDSVFIKYKTAALQWNVSKGGPNEIDLCVPVPFEIDLTDTKYADIKNLQVLVDMPTHASFDFADSAQYYYPISSSPRTIPGSAYINPDGKQGWDIAALVGGNLPGTRSSNNKLKLNFNITTSCGFDPGLPIKYTVTGFTNCGERIQFIDQRKIKLQGFSLDELTLTLSGNPPKCHSDNDIQLTLQNSGEQPSSMNQLEVVLPEGLAYKEILQSDLPAPAVTLENNQTKLSWTLADGYLVGGQTKSLSLRAYLSETPLGATGISIKARTFQSGDAHCAETNTTCSTVGTSGSDELLLPVVGPSSLDIKYKKYSCAYQFKSIIDATDSCKLKTYAWDFGDQVTSNDISPLHSFPGPGNYTVSLKVDFQCGSCSGSQEKQIQVTIGPKEVIMTDSIIDVISDAKLQVISCAASTFADAWSLQSIDPNVQSKNSFFNGKQGVWRNDGSYAYDIPREQSAAVNISKDGTYTAQQFNWQLAEFNAIPHWTKANSITQYSPYSYELENQDVLGIYSAALYDYGGQLPSANGVNMRNNEMAFTSFEFLDNKSSGNWLFGNQPMPAYSQYKVNIANNNIALVEASLSQLEKAEQVDVKASGLFGFFFGKQFGYVSSDQIVCRQVYPKHPEWSIIVLQQAPLPFLWSGDITIKNVVEPEVSPDIDNTFAHSGKSSLKITAEKTFKQNLIKLDSGKAYFISAWVSVKNPYVTTPTLAQGLEIEVTIKDKNEQKVTAFHFQPTGRIIEGWQQVRGTFICPVRDALIETKFKPGTTNPAWYDDLRIHPEKGNMRSYVYNMNDYRLRAILDEENFASFFYYDAEGNLYLTKKETEEGIKTISENVSYQKETVKKDN